MRKPIAIYAQDVDINLEECCQNARYWGVNTLILSPDLFDEPELPILLNKYQLALWLNIPVFNNPSYLKEHPDKIAVSNTGNLAQQDWCQFICPSDTAYIEHLKAQITEYLDETNPDYISLDFLRQYLYWQDKSYDEIAPEDIEYGCFCSRCMNAFYHSDFATSDATAEIESREFSADFAHWRSEQIASVAKVLTDFIRQMSPNTSIALNTLPWSDKALNCATSKYAGQNKSRLSEYFDAFCPVAFSHMLPQTADDKKQLLNELNAETQTPIYYGLQVAHWRLKKAIPAEQFEIELKQNLALSKQGMVIYNYTELLADAEKATILKRHLNPEIHF
ncbi:hypothetical protein [Catenovulum sediminis]|uniref:Glycosyl hydrolase-like 10 domain-containing protein n=1 Tax=Catenovulum sediminis TaxID=1740262 RepID=A0ABV1RJH2_9ALTE|nr:hypothetical protein [Catenovulum sediminis]